MNQMSNPDGVNPSSPTHVRRLGIRRRSIIISVIFHGVLLISLLCWYIPQRVESTNQETLQSSSTNVDPPQASVPPPLPPTPGSNVPAVQIEASLKSAMDQTRDLSNERKLTELEKNLERLDSISSAESVQKTTQKIAGVLGLSSGPRPNAQPIVGAFDINTAQIHDVTRSRDDNGNWRYQSVLVDAGGRTQQVELSDKTGEDTFNTFQQLKKFPMANGIYRELVMPMLQKMLAAADASQAQVRKAKQQQAAEQESTTDQRTPSVVRERPPSVPETGHASE